MFSFVIYCCYVERSIWSFDYKLKISLSLSEQHQKDEEEPSFAEVEELFLQTTLDNMDFLTTVEECAIEKHKSSPGFSVHQNLKVSLDHYLLGLAEQLLNNYSPEVSLKKN